MGHFEKWHPLEEFEKEAILDASQQTLDSIKDLEGCCAGWPAELLQPINHLSVAAAEMLECAKADVGVSHRMNELDDLINQIIGEKYDSLTGWTMAMGPTSADIVVTNDAEEAADALVDETVDLMADEMELAALSEPLVSEEMVSVSAAQPVENVPMECQSEQLAEPAAVADAVQPPPLSADTVRVRDAAEPHSYASGTAIEAPQLISNVPGPHLLFPPRNEPLVDCVSEQKHSPPLLKSKKEPSGMTGQITTKGVKIYHKSIKLHFSAQMAVPSQTAPAHIEESTAMKSRKDGIICSPNLRISSQGGEYL